MPPKFLYKDFIHKHQKLVDGFWAWVGSSLCLLCIALLDEYYFQAQYDINLLMASFGASTVLVFGAHTSPLAQPRNIIGGHFISAIAGVTCQIFLGHFPTLAICTSVSLAILLMTLTKTLHPPGGATALLAVVGDVSVKKLGYLYAVTPCLVGATIVVTVGVFLSYATGRRQYPLKWW